MRDEAARILCEIIDDDAPLNWARYRSVVDCIASNERLLELLNKLKWQTIDEFDVEGWCWITVDGNVDMAYYAGGLFYYDDACDKTVYDTWPASTITHVQHIPKPEAPK